MMLIVFEGGGGGVMRDQNNRNKKKRRRQYLLSAYKKGNDFSLLSHELDKKGQRVDRISENQDMQCTYIKARGAWRQPGNTRPSDKDVLVES
jgi:hypothetical protein